LVDKRNRKNNLNEKKNQKCTTALVTKESLNIPLN